MENTAKLTIGRISYTNLFPIFYTLEREADCSSYEFIDGVPSVLNRSIWSGDIDVSPSSSIEYLRHQDGYRLIEGHSISSFGPIGSIFLFSKRPIEALDGLTVLATSQSETSVALLTIILKKFYELDCRVRTTAAPLHTVMQSHEACLLIGDDALREAARWPQFRVYDLGDVWYRHTGLPSVFALWIVRKDSAAAKAELVERFVRDLDRARDSALRNFREIADHSWLREIIPADEIVEYWQGISFDLGKEHMKGLDLFRRYAGELSLLNK
ncbi:MAG: menaquinone biosynthesis protein [Nitrospiraceae bacterium]|nr:menaquinone biosynthesis protein [Nitrospiraceae bacterium]